MRMGQMTTRNKPGTGKAAPAAFLIFTLVITLTLIPLLSPAGPAKQPPPKIIFAVTGDTQIVEPAASTSPGCYRILEEIDLINPDLFFHTGDLIFGYGDDETRLHEEFNHAFELLATMVPPVLISPGNHDYCSPQAIQYFNQKTGHPDGYFSLVKNDVAFIILNTEIPGQVGEITGKQRAWLAAELEKHKQARAIFLFMHRPSFVTHKAETVSATTPLAACGFASIEARDNLLDLITRFPVSAVFSGHEHHFSRHDYKGIPFFTNGG